MIEIFILSSIQGVTEFLPISSSSHLILISNFINFQMQSLVIDVSLHIGSLIAVVTYFYKDVLELGIHVGNNRLMFISTEHEMQDITNIVSVFTTVLSKFSSELAK